tara:strand:- start:724 stop:1038 length:315 start_codon:yes stop_codon:yes gene_type:complete
MTKTVKFGICCGDCYARFQLDIIERYAANSVLLKQHRNQYPKHEDVERARQEVMKVLHGTEAELEGAFTNGASCHYKDWKNEPDRTGPLDCFCSGCRAERESEE